MLLQPERPAGVDGYHFINTVTEQKTPVQHRDMGVFQRYKLAVEIDGTPLGLCCVD
jgi:hypothetical protein